ncbi:hypothetical protein MG293_017042 [Ovis ammon polii]|uniref:Uncharacterized protein n=1 Tax=Ovis ammon polii TaxID=230172 RepID=A0AAD4TUJ5_OVIAM|nr:hypothetical protein MG293_017042 [Ovis ammon polii]
MPHGRPHRESEPSPCPISDKNLCALISSVHLDPAYDFRWCAVQTDLQTMGLQLTKNTIICGKCPAATSCGLLESPVRPGTGCSASLDFHTQAAEPTGKLSILTPCFQNTMDINAMVPVKIGSPQRSTGGPKAKGLTRRLQSNDLCDTDKNTDVQRTLWTGLKSQNFI